MGNLGYNAGAPYACVVAKQHGKGRGVVFSPHPEEQHESRPLTRNAILWAAKVTDTEDPAPHQDAEPQ